MNHHGRRRRAERRLLCAVSAPPIACRRSVPRPLCGRYLPSRQQRHAAPTATTGNGPSPAVVTETTSCRRQSNRGSLVRRHGRQPRLPAVAATRATAATAPRPRVAVASERGSPGPPSRSAMPPLHRIRHAKHPLHRRRPCRRSAGSSVVPPVRYRRAPRRARGQSGCPVQGWPPTPHRPGRLAVPFPAEPPSLPGRHPSRYTQRAARARQRLNHPRRRPPDREG